MDITVTNSHSIRYGYRLSYSTYSAYQELERYYGPYDLFKKVTTYFRTSSELPSFMGKGVYSDIDYIIQAMFNDFGQSPNLSQSLFGGGKGSSFYKLYISTLGEMFERILGAFALFSERDKFVFASARELRSKQYQVCGPDEIHIFAKEQLEDPDFLFSDFTDDTTLNWYPMKRAISGQTVWVPAQLVFIYYPMTTPEEYKIGYATSGGLSLHDDRTQALLHGITECIERDQINLRWYDQIPLERIDLDDIEGLSRYGKDVIASGLERDTHTDAYLHNVDIPEVPVVTVISNDGSLDKYAFCAGGGSGLSLAESVESAYREYSQSELNLKLMFYCPNWYSSSMMSQLFGFDADFDLQNMSLFYEIVPYYGLKENRHSLDWYLGQLGQNSVLETVQSVERPKSDDDPSKELDACLSMLDSKGIDPLIVDFTPEGFSHISLMKSFIPDLTFAFLPNRACLGHPRFYQAARKAGLIDHDLTFDELNTAPLPFP